MVREGEAAAPAPPSPPRPQQAAPRAAATDTKLAEETGPDPCSLVGERVASRFAVCRYLGHTSAAWVYRAVHTGLAVPCFLKVAERDPRAEGSVPDRLRREARAASAVRHPALLRVLDAGTWEGYAYLAQEWADGPTLRAVIARGRVVTVSQAILLALDLLSAIGALHRRGILVRALEPERIIVREEGEKREAKLFDLSRAHFLGEAGPPPGAERPRSGGGIVVRSARYLSPEEILEAPPDPRSDLYSFGLVLYELLTGEFPYADRGGGPTSWIVSHLRELPRPLELPPERGAVPEDLPGILRRLLAKRPQDRFETADAVLRALEDVVVPDLVRYGRPGGQKVLEAWRQRVRSGLLRTVERPVPSEPSS